MRGLQRLSLNCNYILLCIIRLLVATDDDLAKENPSCMLLDEDSSKILEEYKSQAKEIFEKSDEDLKKLEIIADQIKEYNDFYGTCIAHHFPHELEQELIEYVTFHLGYHKYTEPKYLVNDAIEAFQRNIFVKEKEFEGKTNEIMDTISYRYLEINQFYDFNKELRFKMVDRLDDYKFLRKDLFVALCIPIVRH